MAYRPRKRAGRPSDSTDEQRLEGELAQRCTREHREGHGPSDGVRRRSKESSGGTKRVAGKRRVGFGRFPQGAGDRSRRAARNAANPRVGSGMKQARRPCAEEAVEVVRNHGDGTGLRRWYLRSRREPARVTGSGRARKSRRRGEFRGPRECRSGANRAGSDPRPDESHGREAELRPGRCEGLRSGVKTRKVLDGYPVKAGTIARRPRRPPRCPPATVKHEGGAGKTTDPPRGVRGEPRSQR